jgi:hypothetical protein
MVISKYPLLSVSEARELARATIRGLSDPVTANNYSADTFPILENAYKSYVTNFILKSCSLYEYNKVFRVYLDQFHNLSIDQITEEVLVSVYLVNCDKRSIAQNNKSMKIMQAALMNSGLPDNPVQVLSRKRLIRQLKPKTSYVQVTFVYTAYIANKCMLDNSRSDHSCR